MLDARRRGRNAVAAEARRNGPTELSPTDSKAGHEKEDPDVLLSEFKGMIFLLFVAVATYGGRTFTTLLVNDLVRLEDLDASYRFMLLSSFYWGYAPPQLFGGWLAQKLGGKHAMMLCLSGMTIGFAGTYILLSTAGEDVTGRIGMIAGLRFIDGLCQCLYVPTMYILYRERVATKRRSKYQAMMSLGSRAARFGAATLEPWLVHGVFESVVPVFAILGGFVSTVLTAWTFFLPPPRKVLSASAQRRGNTKVSTREQPIPLFGGRFWRLMLYGPSIVCALVHFSGNWLNILVETYSLRYYTDVTNTSLVKATLFSSSPMVVGLISPIVCVALEMLLQDTLNFRLANVRRAHSCLALVLISLAMVTIAMTQDANVFCWATVAALLGQGLHTAGYAANYAEIGGGSVMPWFMLHFSVVLGC